MKSSMEEHELSELNLACFVVVQLDEHGRCRGRWNLVVSGLKSFPESQCKSAHVDESFACIVKDKDFCRIGVSVRAVVG